MTNQIPNILSNMEQKVFNIDQFLEELNKDLIELYKTENEFSLDVSTYEPYDPGREEDSDTE